MFGHRIVSALLAWLKAAITGLIFHTLLMILLSNRMQITDHFYEVFFFSVFNFAVYIFSSALYFIAILLPLTFIDRKAFEEHDQTDLLYRYLPIATTLFICIGLFFLVFIPFIKFIGNEGYVIILNFYNTIFTCLFFFIKTAKQREAKIKN